MTTRPRHRFVRVASIAAAALALAIGSALAAAPAPRVKRAHTAATRPAPVATVTQAEPARVPAAQPGALGLMAFLDPETGLLTGPILSLLPPADRRTANANVLLEQVPLPGGGWMIDLKGAGMESYVVQLDALGHPSVSCVQDVRAVQALPPVPVAPARKER
jgi:hypothetical protein